MAKPNAFVKISGNLIEKEDVLGWLKNLSRKYFVVVCIGGGKQINKAFQDHGFDINFGTLGRITKTLEERQVARDVLEQNQAMIQDLLDEQGIHARVSKPVLDIATVLCHVNGDIQVLAAYNGYDSLYILTLESKVKDKETWLKKLAECFVPGEEDARLDKIKVIGF